MAAAVVLMCSFYGCMSIGLKWMGLQLYIVLHVG